MLNEQQAYLIARQHFPLAVIEKPILYRDVYLFQVYDGDDDETEFDPYYSVNVNTEEFRDFSIITDGNIQEITELYAKQKNLS